MIQGNFRYFLNAFKHFVGDLQGRVLMDYTKEFKTTSIITPILTRRKYSCVYWVFFFLKLLAITHAFTDFLLDSILKTFFVLFLDYALSGYSGRGGPGRRGKEGDGGNPAVCLDWQTAAKADLERQVIQSLHICFPHLSLLDVQRQVKVEALDDVHQTWIKMSSIFIFKILC